MEKFYQDGVRVTQGPVILMQEFIAKIAKGPRAAKDLTWDEAKRAMKALIEGETTPAQVGAFFIAMRIKMESVTELRSEERRVGKECW